MLRWISKQKTKTGQQAETEAAQTANGNELEFLRQQGDFDAEEMAGVRTAPEPGLAPEAGEPEGMAGFQHPGVTQPAIRFQESLYKPERDLEAAANCELGDPGDLTLAVIVEGHSAILTVSDSALVGREDLESHTTPEVDLSDDDAVSRRHARIFRRGGRFWLCDLDSTNGTLLNGAWLEPDVDAPLRVGDMIEVGEISRLKVLDITFHVELTDEDQMLSGLLDEALGATPAAAAWAPKPAREPERVAATDLLDLALARGTEAGLLPTDAKDVEAELPAEWRIRDLDGLDVPSMVEPAR